MDHALATLTDETAGHYEILLRERKGSILAALKPVGPDPHPPSVDDIHQALIAEGYGELQFLEEGIEQLLANPPRPAEPASDAEEAASAEAEPTSSVADEATSAEAEEAAPPIPFAPPDEEELEEFIVAERHDAEIAIEISEDEMHASLTLTPPRGGQPVTPFELDMVLKQKEISFGLDREAIDKALAEGHAEQVTIASGIPPVDGEDSQFLSLIPEMRRRGPRIRADGTADYRDLNLFLTVSRGDPLMRRAAPTEGTPGTNIKGLSLRPVAGQVLDYDPNLEGVEIAPKDPDLLLAATGGQPVLVDHGVNVEPVLNVKTIDLSTGNVAFDGNITVEGDVAPLMRLKATGDILVSGVVEAATLEAGGDIFIKKGLIGHHKPNHDDREGGADDPEYIRCDGTLHTRFIENYRVSVGTSVVVEELVAHSEITAGKEVIVGNERSKRGAILGGITRAHSAIIAKNIGSDANPHTELEVGFEPHTHRQYESISEVLSNKLEEKRKLQTIITYLTNNKTPDVDTRFVKVRQALARTDGEIASLSAIQQEMVSVVKECERAHINVGNRIYAGVHLIIAGKALLLQDERGTGSFHLEEGEISFP